MVPKHRSIFTLAQACWSQRLRRHRQSPSQSQLWSLHRRKRGIADRHLDAAHRGGLAYLATDRFGRWLGAMAFADLFPTVIIGPVAGAAADRWDRLRVTKISQALAMAQSVVLFLLTISGLITIELLLVLTAALGVIAGFNQPARLALIPSLVRREDMAAAVAINSIIFNSARFIGPAVAGFMIVAGGISAAFAANAVSFVFFLVALSRIHLNPSPPPSGRSGDRCWAMSQPASVTPPIIQASHPCSCCSPSSASASGRWSSCCRGSPPPSSLPERTGWPS